MYNIQARGGLNISKSRRRFTAEFNVALEAAKGLKTLNALCLISLLPALLVSTLILPIRGPKDGANLTCTSRSRH